METTSDLFQMTATGLKEMVDYTVLYYIWHDKEATISANTKYNLKL